MTAKPKAKIAKTAVAAVARYRPFEDSLEALGFHAADKERIANKKSLETKLDTVRLALKNPKSMTECERDAKKIVRWLRREINKECKKLGCEEIKEDNAHDLQQFDRDQRQQFPQSEVALKRDAVIDLTTETKMTPIPPKHPPPPHLWGLIGIRDEHTFVTESARAVEDQSATAVAASAPSLRIGFILGVVHRNGPVQRYVSRLPMQSKLLEFSDRSRGIALCLMVVGEWVRSSQSATLADLRETVPSGRSKTNNHTHTHTHARACVCSCM